MSLWRLPATRSMVASSALGFTGYWLTLASLPVYAVGGGTSEVVAGSVTAAFLVVTIAVQSVVPALTERFGATRVLVAGLLALGLPSPLYAVDDGLGWLLWISAVRGIGFAILTVLGSVLAGRIVPPERRGEAVGLYGLSVAVPNLVAVPAGVALVLHGGAGWMAWLAALPVLAVPFVPGLVRGARSDDDEEPTAGAGRRAAVSALAPSAVLFVATLAGGGVITYLPIERPSGALASTALLVVGAAGALVRWPSGVLADRMGTRLLLPGLVAVLRARHAGRGRRPARGGLARARRRRGVRGRLRRGAEPDAGVGVRPGRRGWRHRRGGGVERDVRRRHRDRRARAGRGGRRARAAVELRAGLRRAAARAAGGDRLDPPIRGSAQHPVGGRPQRADEQDLLGAAQQPGAQPPGAPRWAGRRAN